MSLTSLLRSAALVLLLGLSGCALGSGGPSQVARGEYYAAGKPEYDAFFIELHQKQVDLLSAPAEPKSARDGLTRPLSLTADASDDSLRERLGQEVRKLSNQGLRLRLEVPEPNGEALDASATLHTSDPSAATPLREALPQSTTRLVRSRNRMLATKAALEKLRVAGIRLEGGVDEAFRIEGPWKRDEVRKNLEDGQKMITIMLSRAQEVFDVDQKLIALISSTATSDPSVGKVPAYTPPAAEESDEKPSRRGNARSSGARPTSPRPVPAAKPAGTPAPRPREGDDAAAAPKPTQGSAPAEIEP